MTKSTTNKGAPSTTGHSDDEKVAHLVTAALSPSADHRTRLKEAFEPPSTCNTDPFSRHRLHEIINADFSLTDREIVSYPLGLDAEQRRQLIAKWHNEHNLELRTATLLKIIAESDPEDAVIEAAQSHVDALSAPFIEAGDFELLNELLACFDDTDVLSSHLILDRLLDALSSFTGDAQAIPQPLIQRIFQSHDRDLRLRFLKLDGPWWNEPEIAEDYLLDLLADRSQKIRRSAGLRLAHCHPDQFVDHVQAIIDSQDYGRYSLGELQFLFDLFAKSTSQASKRLGDVVVHSRGWFNKASQNAIRAASRTLLQEGEAEIVSRIENRAQSLLTAPRLRRSLTAVLELHDTPANPSDQQ